MGITTTFSANTWEESLIDIIFEFLTDSNCFGVSGTNITIVPYEETLTTRLDIPRLEYEIIDANNVPTGAGLGGSEDRFRTIFVEFTFKVTRGTGEAGRKALLNLVRQTDTLDKYCRSSNGYAKLGTAGIRKGELNGPMPANDKNFFSRKFLLSGEIEVT